MPKAFITRVEGDVRGKILDGLDFIGWEEIVAPEARVFIKPNLTWPVYQPGVTTSPSLLDALLSLLRDRTSNITVCESDGGMHSFEAEEAFSSHNLHAICEKYGADLMNLSKQSTELVPVTAGRRRAEIALPSVLLHEADVFITVPVAKTHCMTTVSLALKNQWGCVPDTMRLLHHHVLSEALIAIDRLLRPKIAIVDALFAQDGNGPLFGEPVPLDTVIVADSAAAVDVVTCTVMGVDIAKVPHLALGVQQNVVPAIEQILLNEDPSGFQTHQFRVKRVPLDWISILLAKRYWMTKLVYDSWLTKPIYGVLDTLRGGKPADRAKGYLA